MFCHNCGAMYPANARFCTRCGCARIDYSCQSAPAPVVQPDPAPPVQPLVQAPVYEPVPAPVCEPVPVPVYPPVQAPVYDPVQPPVTMQVKQGSHAVPLAILGGLMTFGLVLYFLTSFSG